SGGGAAFFYHCKPIFTDCKFIGNIAESGGGGGLSCIAFCDPILTNCTFTENERGGMECYTSTAILTGCTFSNNVGWGLKYSNSLYMGPEIITGCTFTGNTGEGLILTAPNALVTNCVFEGNGNSGLFMGGGGVVTDCVITANYGGNGAVFGGGGTLENCIISDNFTRAIHSPLGGGTTFLRCTIVGNSGDGIYLEMMSTPELENCILAFNTGQAVNVRPGDPADPILTCCDLFGNAGGDTLRGIDGGGNFSADPLFCDPTNDDFTLNNTSPCLPGNHPDGEDCGLIGARGQGCGEIVISFDIHPRSCPNPFNIKWLENFDHGNEHALPKKGGVMPSAIVGSENFDVTEIDVSTLRLEGIMPLRHSFEDVTRPAADGEECDCTTDGPDGLMDLTLKFRRLDIAAVLGLAEDGDIATLTLTGSMLDGTSFEASDCVTILSKRPRPPVFSGPDQVVLHPAVPNPFNPVTRIRYALPSEGFVKLVVYDVTGRLVEQLVAQMQHAGEHIVTWDARKLRSGIYFYRLEVGSFTETRKLILLK
ncbi:MAG: right-handed parallel beta-helix repeat-containing protein, partial [Planctomycetota bacterium]